MNGFALKIDPEVTFEDFAHSKILSRTSEVGSPTKHLGSRQRQDVGQGSPKTGSIELVETRLIFFGLKGKLRSNVSDQGEPTL